MGLTKIGIISDTHNHLDERIVSHLSDVDEIWHAGDIGEYGIIEQLEDITTVRAVYGNIDGQGIRDQCPENLIFEIDGLKVVITHIGGYPYKYTSRVRKLLETERPNLYICGHSHITKILPDKKLNLLHINPGAAGTHGFHHIRTLVKVDIRDGKMENLRVVELGKRSQL